MNFSMIEIIKLITRLYMPLSGYWIDEIKENAEAYKFAEAGYMSLNDEYKDKYIINSKGKEYLHPYIERISNNFITFMKKHQMSCSTEEIINWYAEKYSLDDVEIAKDIAEYICTNLETYNYRATPFHSSRQGNGYQIENLVAAHI